MAAPTAGTWDVATPATILATSAVLPLRLEAIAVDGTAAVQHHVGVALLGHAGHHGGELLKGFAVSGAELGGEVDVAAQFDHAVPVAVQNGLLLLGRHWKAVEIGGLVGLEGGAVVRLHQRHTELIEPVALAGAIGIEDRRPGDVVVAVMHWSVIMPARRGVILEWGVDRCVRVTGRRRKPFRTRRGW